MDIVSLFRQQITVLPRESRLSEAPDAGTKWHPEARMLMSWDHYANYFNLDQDLAVTAQRNYNPLLA